MVSQAIIELLLAWIFLFLPVLKYVDFHILGLPVSMRLSQCTCFVIVNKYAYAAATAVAVACVAHIQASII